jgi:undecaprenyl diphosphate synthase
MVLTVAFDYGSRAEIARAARLAAVDAVGSGGSVTPVGIARHLYDPELPPVDVLVRTSGETRISNFLLWQAREAHVYFTDAAWPDFGADELDAALALIP